ncbi:hypothetical protein PO909_000507, partial [Leuciscus waleckii]
NTGKRLYDLNLLIIMQVWFMVSFINIIMITEIYCVSGISGVKDHVFISSGGNVRLSCNNALSDCKSKTTWIYSNRFRHSAAVELITGGKKNKDTEKHERLSLEFDCSLNIKNVTVEEDYGLYSCRQYVNGQKQGPDADVYLHVLHGKFMIMWSI